MSRFLPLPLKMYLSYTFAAVAGQPRLCTRVHKVFFTGPVYGEFNNKIVRHIDEVCFSWFEAVPVKGENDLYQIQRHLYYRHGKRHISGDRAHVTTVHPRQRLHPQHGPYLTRAEALAAIADADMFLAQEEGMHPIATPLVMRGFRPPPPGRPTSTP